MKLQEFVLWLTIGALLNAIGYSFDSWQFWCSLATYWSVAQVGKVQGVVDYIDMDASEQEEIRNALKDERNGESK
jgi:GH25 family lysozyme M1 (1,4-beta-N-acetylmuramidase)